MNIRVTTVHWICITMFKNKNKKRCFRTILNLNKKQNFVTDFSEIFFPNVVTVFSR